MAAARGNPRILAFVCSWHPLAAADNAGADGRSYGTATSIVPVNCAGTISAAAIIKAFSAGADGVLITACGQGDCHYSNGNESCEKVVEETRDLMRLAGVVPQRLRLDLSSDVDGGRFVALLDEFAAEIVGLNGRGGRGRSAPSRSAKKKPLKAKQAKAAVRKKPAKKVKAAPAKKVVKKAAPKKKAAKKAVKKAAPKTRVAPKKKVAPKKPAVRAKRKR